MIHDNGASKAEANTTLQQDATGDGGEAMLIGGCMLQKGKDSKVTRQDPI